MLDALVKHLVQEVGLKGTVGIHPDKIAGLAQGFFDLQAQAHLLPGGAASSSTSGRRRSTAQYTQVLDPPYISYLLGVLLEHDDVLLSASLPAGAAAEASAAISASWHEVSREEYAEAGLDFFRARHGSNLAIRLTDDAACLVVAGQRREYLPFSDLTLSILSTISSKGSEGISGVALSRQYNLTPKDTFYHTKKLVNEGLVVKMSSTEGGAHTSHFIHHRAVSRGGSFVAAPTAAHSAEAPELHRRFLNNYDYLEPRVMAIFDNQPKGVLRTLQIWGKDGFLLRQMGYRGRLDNAVSSMVKRLIRAMVTRGKLRRINVRNTTGLRNKGLIAAYQAMSHVDSGDAGANDVEVEFESNELGLDEVAQAGDQKPLVGDREPDGMAVILYDPSEKEPAQPPPRFEPVSQISPSTPVDYQVLQYILDGGTAGRFYKDVMSRFAFSRRFIEWLADRWSLKEGAPLHLPETNILQVTDQIGKERRLILFGSSGYRALCRQLSHPVDPAICSAEETPDAGGFLPLANFELWDEPQQRVEWAESYPLETFQPATVAPKDLLPFLPVIADENERLNKNQLRALLGCAGDGEWLGTLAVASSGSAKSMARRTRGKGNGPQKKMVARMQRIAAGDEVPPSDAGEYRRMVERAKIIGLTIPPRPVPLGKRGRSSSITPSVASVAFAGLSQSPAPVSCTKKRGRTPATSTDGEPRDISASSSAVKTPTRKRGPAKTPRRSALNQTEVPLVAMEALPSVERDSTAPLAPPSPPIDGVDSALSMTEARPRKIRRKSIADDVAQLSHPSLPAVLPSSAVAPPAAQPSPSAQPLEAVLSAASALTEDTLPMEPRPSPSTQKVSSAAVDTPNRLRPSRKKVVHRLPRTSEVEAAPTVKARRGNSGSTAAEDMTVDDPTTMLGSTALAAPGPSIAGVVLSFMPTTDSPDFLANGPAPPIEDARARLRRKQQEAKDAKEERRKLRRKEVIELDLGADVGRREHEQPPATKSGPNGPRKERSDKGKRKSEGRWIFPTEEEKKARAKKAAKKAAAGGAATAENVMAGQKAADPSPTPAVEHSYIAVLPEDTHLIPDIVNQVGRPAGSDAQRHRTRHNDELDDVIMDIGSIICVRGSVPGYMYSWKPALRIIPGVTTTTIRSRFHKLQDSHGSYIYQLEMAYLRMWNTVGNTALLPDAKHPKGDFDIAHHLRFFRKNIDKAILRTNADVSQVEGELESRVPDLPGHVSAMAALKLEDNTHVLADAFDYSWLHVPKQNVSDDLSELASRNNLFLIEPSAASQPSESDQGRREDSVLASTVKMVCSTSDADFDPHQADAVLPKTGRSGEIIRDLILEGVCDSRNDEVNGRIGFTEQFKTFSTGPHTHSFFAEASEVEGSILIKEEHSPWPLLASDGHTAALLYLSSQNRIELETERDDLETLCAGATLRNSKKLDDVDLEFHISARLTDLPKAAANIQIPPSFDLDHGPIALDVEERSAVLDSLTENDAAGLMAISKRIVEYLDLQEIGGDGAPWAVIQALCPELSLLELVHLTLELAQTMPPLVFVTGYDKPRLVSTLFIAAWAAFVPTPKRVSPPDDAAESEAPAESSKVMVWPRRWVDMHANIVESDWDGCIRLVVGHLLDRSGITEVSLRRLLLPVLDRLEMSEILRHLLQLRMARRVVYAASTLSPLAVSNAELAEWPIGWLGPDEERRVGWELVGGAWTEGLDEQQGLA